MKKAKRLVSLLLAVVMLLSLAVSAGASGAGTAHRAHVGEGPDHLYDPNNKNDDGVVIDVQGTGKITITNAVVGETYKIYQILYLDSLDTTGTTSQGTPTNLEGGKYAYKANSSWVPFVQQCIGTYLKYVDASGSTDPAEAGGAVNPTDTDRYIAWISDTTPADTTVAQFARKAKEYTDAKEATTGENSQPAVLAMQPIAEIKAESTTVEFTNLKLGYYLVDSSVGALCNLDTTNNVVNMLEKNIVPTNVKQVQEDSNTSWNGTGTDGTNDADIGQEIKFHSTITIEKGTSVDNLIFHDKMSDGLTFDYNNDKEHKADNTEVPENKQDKIKVSCTTRSSSEIKWLKQDTDYIVEYPAVAVPGATEDCTFHIKFTDSFLSSLDVNAYIIVVEYSAYLNKNAVIGDGGNLNTSKVSFGDNNTYTLDSTTKSKTWELPVRKVTGKGELQKGLAGAKFSLKLKDGSDTKIQFVKDDACKSIFDPSSVAEIAGETPAKPTIDKYRVATPAEIADNNVQKFTIITTNNDGYFVLVGLDSGTYTLTEEEAPAGFSVLDDPLTISIQPSGQINWNTKQVQMVNVVNNPGTELPSTGGIGTTIFYVAGSILLVGAAILLIVKKRMSDEK